MKHLADGVGMRVGAKPLHRDFGYGSGIFGANASPLQLSGDPLNF